MSTPTEWRLCPRCGHYLPADAFRESARDISRASAGVAVCIPCEQDIRDLRKAADRWRVKAKTTRRSHAKRLRITGDVLRDSYGWDLEPMARDMEHAYEGMCPGCHQSFKVMPNGIQDLTLDIIDRSAPPIYGSNTRFLCQTCNRSKGAATMRKHNAIQLAYAIRRGEPMVPRLFDPGEQVFSPRCARSIGRRSSPLPQQRLF